MLGFIPQPNLRISHFGGNPTSLISKKRSVKSIRYLHLPNREDFTAFNLARSRSIRSIRHLCCWVSIHSTQPATFGTFDDRALWSGLFPVAIDCGDVGFRFTLPNLQLSVRLTIELCGADYSQLRYRWCGLSYRLNPSSKIYKYWC